METKKKTPIPSKVVKTTGKKPPPNLTNAGKGRVKGTPNKTTALLKDAILLAAQKAGDNAEKDGGIVAYLVKQAEANPTAFMGLLGKVLPMQIVGDPDNPLKVVTTVELVAPSVKRKA